MKKLKTPLPSRSTLKLEDKMKKLSFETRIQNYLLSLTPEKVKEIPGAVFVLLADGDGTMRSTDQPFGVAVTTEAEAKRYVKEGKVGYSHSYEKVTIFDNKDDAIRFRFGKKGF